MKDYARELQIANWAVALIPPVPALAPMLAERILIDFQEGSMKNDRTDCPRCLRMVAIVPMRPLRMNKRKKKIRVLLVDDHPVVRKGIHGWLDGVEHLQVLGEAVDGEDAVAKARELSPDVVLMDVDMPKMNGLEATKVIRKELPNTRVLILSMQTNKSVVLQIIQSGAQGYVLKDAPPADLLRAIESVDAGEAFFSPDINQIVLNQYLAETNADEAANSNKLTNRERQVLALIAEGQSNKEMAGKLGVGVRTIETHRERMMAKLDIHSVAGLTKFAITNGIVNLE